MFAFSFLQDNKIFPRLLISLFLVCFLAAFILPDFAQAAVPPPNNLLLPTTQTLPLQDQREVNITARPIAASQKANPNGYGLYYSADGKYYEMIPGSAPPFGEGNTYRLFTASDDQLNQIFAKAQTINANQEAGKGTGASALDSKIPLVGHIIGGILLFIQWALGKLVFTAGTLLDGVLNITRFKNVYAVEHGWTVIRDLCNMFFALILLIIAFATILHLESYGMKQLLWKLVVAAILINFSFTIAGVIIDFSQVLTNFFVNNSKNATNGGQISSTLVLGKGGLNFNELFGLNEGGWGAAYRLGIISLGGPTIGVLIDMLLIIILLLVALFAVLGLVILFLIRIIALWVILIFAPLAWLCMVLPATKSIWDKWWDALLRWSFFAPLATFLLYIAIVIVQKGGIAQVQINGPLAVSGQYMSSFLNNPAAIMQYIMVIGMLVASVVIAQKMGIMGASAVVNLGKSAKNLALGAIAGGTLGAGAWAGRKILVATGKAVADTGAQWAATAERWRQTQGWRAVVARPAAKLLGQASRLPTMYAERARQEIAKQKKAYAAWSTESKMREIPVASPAARAALLESMGADVSKLPDDWKKYLPEFERIGGDMDAVMPYRPDWGKDDADVKHWASEAVRIGADSKWNTNTVSNIKVLDALRDISPSASAYAARVNKFTGEVRDAILKTMQANFSDDFTDRLNLRRRKSYARTTGDIQIAYQDSAKQIAQTGGQADAVAQYIRELNSRQLGDVEKNRLNATLLARHMTADQAGHDQGEIKAYMKTMIKEEAEAHNQNLDLLKAIKRLAFWNINVKRTASKPPNP